MRIIHLLTTSSPVTTPFGGAVERIVISLAREQALAGHDVHIFSVNDVSHGSLERNLQIHNVSVRLKRPFSDLEYLFRVRKRVRELRPEVIHSHSSPFSAFIVKSSNAARVATFNFFRFRGSKNRFGRRVYRYLLFRFDLITSITRFSAVGISNYFSLSSVPEILSCGVDLSEFNPELGLINSTNPFEIEPNLVYALFVGRLNEQKGVQYLSPIATELTKKGISLLAAGPINQFGMENNTNIEKFPYGAGVKYLGSVDQSWLPQLMANAKVLVVPTVRDEMFGMVIIEAGACGTPSVASHIDAIPEVLGNAGVLVQVGDVAAFVKAISDLVADPVRLDVMSDAAIRNAASFSWTRICSESVKYYHYAIAKISKSTKQNDR